MAPTLKELFGGRVPPRQARISVSGPSVLIRRVTLPMMTHLELEGAIRFEAESHIPFPINDCILDFQILNPVPEKRAMNVLLVAAKRDFIQGRIKLLTEAGIPPELIDVDIFCLINAFEMLSESSGKNLYGLLDIGHETSAFAIVQNNLPYFVREISAGSHEVTKALMLMKNIQEAEADRLKKAAAPEMSEDLKTATQKGFDHLVDEIKHSIDYFENEAGEELKSIWISGGGALSAGAVDCLAAALGKQVLIWNDGKKLDVAETADKKLFTERSAEFNVALGMVLRGTSG